MPLALSGKPEFIFKTLLRQCHDNGNDDDDGDDDTCPILTKEQTKACSVIFTGGCVFVFQIFPCR